MSDESQQHLAVHLSGQDDNLGDSALRDGLMKALRGRNRKFNIFVRDQRGMDQSSDYMAGLALEPTDTVYDSRREWLSAGPAGSKPVHVFNAGEINPRGRLYPGPARVHELSEVQSRGGIIIAAGIGIKNPHETAHVRFAPAFRNADLMSWRDYGSQEAAGFGEVNPDWAFSLGTETASWAPVESRPHLTVTLRFDRPYPDRRWFDAVRELAYKTNTRIATVAQVGRDAPRAMRLAEELDGEYSGSPSFNHATLDAHVRGVFSKSLAVISDRAHGLIIGATEGAYPLGSGSEPQKIWRLLDTVGLGSLVGSHEELGAYSEGLSESIPNLAPAIDTARKRLTRLTLRLHALLGSVKA